MWSTCFRLLCQCVSLFNLPQIVCFQEHAAAVRKRIAIRKIQACKLSEGLWPWRVYLQFAWFSLQISSRPESPVTHTIWVSGRRRRVRLPPGDDSASRWNLDFAHATLRAADVSRACDVINQGRRLCVCVYGWVTGVVEKEGNKLRERADSLLIKNRNVPEVALKIKLPAVCFP